MSVGSDCSLNISDCHSDFSREDACAGHCPSCDTRVHLAYLRPDPLSNIRPIIYATPLYKPSNSPYSASEFPLLKPSEQKLYELQMSTKMHKERVDMENHRFWVSLRFWLAAGLGTGRVTAGRNQGCTDIMV